MQPQEDVFMSTFWIIFILLFILVNLFPFINFVIHINNLINAKKTFFLIIKNNQLDKDYLCSYLRKIDPLLFREVIVYLFKVKGLKIKRIIKNQKNRFCFGKTVIDNKTYFIQITKNINSFKYLEEFSLFCESNNANGLFITTGTVPLDYEEYPQYTNIVIINDLKLYELFLSVITLFKQRI